MDAISECCKTGEGNLLDLSIKVQSCQKILNCGISRSKVARWPPFFSILLFVCNLALVAMNFKFKNDASWAK